MEFVGKTWSRLAQSKSISWKELKKAFVQQCTKKMAAVATDDRLVCVSAEDKLTQM